MNVLCIGDIVGKPGRSALYSLLNDLKKEFSIEATIVNGENAAAGAGITTRLAEEMLERGVDVITLGDHVWDQKDLEEFLNSSKDIVRPANLPEECPGNGSVVKTLPSGKKIAVVNMLGRVFMRYNVECPFKKAKAVLDKTRKETLVSIIDFHAEATSEKIALGHYLNGEASVVFGTHTHIQTADETILSKGTAYITDLGMSGPYDSVLGVDKEVIIQRFLTTVPTRFTVASDDVRLSGIVVDIDETTGQAQSINRISRKFMYSAS